MALTAEQIELAQGAKKLLSEPAFVNALDWVVGDATRTAIQHSDAAERENGRLIVLAIARVRLVLQSHIDTVEAEQAAEEQSKAFE